jgi:hypothetical protein
VPRNIEQLDTTEQLSQWWQRAKATIQELCAQHTKLLVVTWKRLQGTIDLLPPSQDIPLEETRTVQTVSSLPGYILRQCRDLVENEQLEVTYYQSGETRATSRFADCDAVLFLGMFYIPAYAIEEYNRVNKSTVTHEDYVQAEIVQALYRSQIRRGKPVSLYFSSDFKGKFIHKVLRYINAVDGDGQPLEVLSFQETLEIKYAHELQALRKNYRSEFLTLVEYDEHFGWSKHTALCLDELHQVVPRSHKRSKEYRGLVKALADIGFTLEIGG